MDLDRPSRHKGVAHRLGITLGIALGLGGLTASGLASQKHGFSGNQMVVEPMSGKPVLNLGRFDLKDYGYTLQEFKISGNATSYETMRPLDDSGEWDVTPAATAPYATRVVAILPGPSVHFNGTVIVEWLNVTLGKDNAFEWLWMHREMLRNGYAYVAVSAQKVGVEGGPAMIPNIQPLKVADPVRYASLHHPGDDFSFDIFSQVGRNLHDRARSRAILGSLRPKRLLAVGHSQSAAYLTTYVNAIDPIARVYDGYLVHSRSGRPVSVQNPVLYRADPSVGPNAVRMRPNLRVPVLVFIAENDLVRPGPGDLGFIGARQDDSAMLRTWEVAGTSHGDRYDSVDSPEISVAEIDSGTAPLGAILQAWAPSRMTIVGPLKHLMNAAPQHHYGVQAALAALDRWVSRGQPPKSHPRMEMVDGMVGETGLDPLARDPVGNAKGGMRSPWMDVPLATFSGMGNSGEIPGAFLSGVTKPFDRSLIVRLYPLGKAQYLGEFTSALDKAIARGAILAADRQEILDLAAATFDRAVDQPSAGQQR